MADIIARFLAEKGIKKIRIHDASKTHPSYIINDIFRYKGVILGSCAYNGNAFPTMETLLFELEHMGVKNHVVAFFGGKAWAGGAMPRFNQFAEKSNGKWLLLLARLAVAQKTKISKRAVISPTLWQINWTKSVDLKRYEKGERVCLKCPLFVFILSTKLERFYKTASK